MAIKCGSNYHFACAGKVIAGGKGASPKMKLDEKDAGGLISDKKSNAE